jgi:hypothetical protein
MQALVKGAPGVMMGRFTFTSMTQSCDYFRCDEHAQLTHELAQHTLYVY